MDSESKLLSLLSQIIYPFSSLERMPEMSKLKSLITQSFSVLVSNEWDSEPKSELKLLIDEINSCLSAISDSKPEFEILSLLEQTIYLISSEDSYTDLKLEALVVDIISHFDSLDSDSELKIWIQQLLSLVRSRVQNSILSLSPQSEVEFDGEKFRVTGGKVQPESQGKEKYSQLESELRSLISQIFYFIRTVDFNMQPTESTLEVGLSWHPQRHSTKSSTHLNTERESKIVSLLTQTISVFSSMELDSLRKPHSVFISHITHIISVYESLLDSEPESELVSLITQMIPLGRVEDSSDLEMGRSAKLILIFQKILCLEPEPEVVTLVNQLTNLVHSTDDEHPESRLIYLIDRLNCLLDSLHLEPDRELVPVTTQIIFLIRSMDLDSQPKSEFKSRITQIISLFSSLSKSEPESELVLCIEQTMHLLLSVDPNSEPTRESDLISLFKLLFFLKPKPEIISLFNQLNDFINPENAKTASELESESESAIITVLAGVSSLLPSMYSEPNSALFPLIDQVITLAINLDLDSQPKSKLKSDISQIISLFYSMVESDPESEVLSLVSQIIDSYHSGPHVISLFKQLFSLEPEPELISLINQLISYSLSVKWMPQKMIYVSPQVEVKLVEGKFRVTGKIQRKKEDKGTCGSGSIDVYRITGDYTGYVRCADCNGEDHEGFEKAPIEVKHPHHPEHSLQLALLTTNSGTRECFCCDEDLKVIFYYCSDCDHAMNIPCVVKPPTFVIYRREWHEQHNMYLFPRRAFLTCNVCSVADLSSPIYLCPPCDFVIHQKCLSLPSVIRISRHPHRISFTPSFDQGDLSCGVCQRNLDNEYGGYSCIKDDCSYAAHSRCATQKNLWDAKELKGQPEEEDKEVGPFVRIGDGIIQHFTHEHHHLRLDENTGRDYDENKQCHACVTPIYNGNFYSCMQCEFILHETCANLSRKMHHPIHPHILSLVGGYGGVVDTKNSSCSACPWLCTGFFYQCDVDGCDLYKLHVQCATISEPLVHVSHMHPLFLTSAPGEERPCWDCKRDWIETFNCIEECGFALCFGCATLPQKVRYKHDKHMLSLSYGNEMSTVTSWCEVCEKQLNPKERVYKCDEYCSIALHTQCLIGGDFYMKPGLSLFHFKGKIDILRNNHHMTRPFCTFCNRRCPGKNVLQCFGSIYCSRDCICYGIKYGK